MNGLKSCKITFSFFIKFILTQKTNEKISNLIGSGEGSINIYSKFWKTALNGITPENFSAKLDLLTDFFQDETKHQIYVLRRLFFHRITKFSQINLQQA